MIFSKTQDKLERVSLILKIAIITFGVTMIILHFVPQLSAYKIWSYIGTVILAFVPDFLRFLKIKIEIRLEIAYYIFLIPAMLLGINLDFYKMIPPMDKVVHTASGVLAAFVADSFLRQTTETKKTWFKAMFVMGMVALTAVLWECYEFTYDQLFDGRMQQLLTMGVSDTMWDMIVALIGGGITTMFLYFRKDQLQQDK